MHADELARAVIAGDRRAWPKLYEILDDKLGAYFQRRLPGAWQDHQDLVQSTIAAVYVKLEQFEDRGEHAFIRWVFGFARIELLRLLDRRSREREALHALARQPTPARTGLSSQVERQQRLALVIRASEQLVDGQRRAVDNLLAGGNAAALAKRAKIQRGSARMVQTRAIRKLRKLVQPTNRTPSDR